MPIGTGIIGVPERQYINISLPCWELMNTNEIIADMIFKLYSNFGQIRISQYWLPVIP